jgi:hypothetical protein
MIDIFLRNVNNQCIDKKLQIFTCLISHSKVYSLVILKGGNNMSKYETLNGKVVVIAGGAKI